MVSSPGLPVGMCSSSVCPSALDGLAAIGPLPWRKRKVHSKSRSFGRTARHMDLPMHVTHKLPDNPKANAETTMLTPGHGALEDIEDASLVFLRDADRVILNTQLRLGAVTNQRDLYWFAGT